MRSSMTLELKQLQRCQHHTKEPQNYIYHSNLEIQMQSFETQNCFITKHTQKFPPQTMIEHVTCSMGGGGEEKNQTALCSNNVQPHVMFFNIKVSFSKRKGFWAAVLHVHM